MSLSFAVITLGVGAVLYCGYKQFRNEREIERAVDEALWKESIENAKEVLARHEKSLQERADELREEMEELEFEAQEEWWRMMEDTLADIRDLDEIEPIREIY